MLKEYTSLCLAVASAMQLEPPRNIEDAIVISAIAAYLLCFSKRSVDRFPGSGTAQIRGFCKKAR